MSENQVRVWDPLVRTFHWTLVVAFTVAYFTGEEESLVHVYAGYLIFGLLAFRIIWGFVGPRYARFSNFIYSPRRTIDYLKSLLSREPEYFIGHNPAGGWMIILLIVSLLLTGYSGLVVYGLEGHGPLAGVEMQLVASAHANDDEHEDDEEESALEEFWEEVHELLANFTVFLVLVHVAGVIVAGWLHRENLVKAMITGNKTVR